MSAPGASGPAGPAESSAPVGVAVVGHGRTASHLLSAAHGILRDDRLAYVVPLDAGPGESPNLHAMMCDAIERIDEGRGVLMLVDLAGASPCQCAQKEGLGHDVVVLAGLNLAMLLKLASLDRTAMTVDELARACADSGQRAVAVVSRQGPSTGEVEAAPDEPDDEAEGALA